MRSYVVMILACLMGNPLFAQVFEYGNSWYTSRKDQPFVKLVVSETGMYRVSREAIEAAGYNLEGSSAETLTLLYRGEEEPLYVHMDANGRWDSLEFYGRRNDGTIEERMYRDPITGLWKKDLQPDKDVSIYTDESAYFLTWANEPGLRYKAYINTNYNDFSPEPHFLFRGKREFHPDSGNVVFQTAGGSTYSANYSLNSDYGPGEGYLFRNAFVPGTPRSITVYTPAAANTGGSATIRVRTYGLSSGIHDLQVTLNENISLIDTSDIPEVYIKTFTRESVAPLSDLTPLRFSATFKDEGNANTNRIAWADVVYDRLPDLRGQADLLIHEWNKADPALYALENVQGQDSVFAFDWINGTRSSGILDGQIPLSSGQLILAPGQGARPIFLVSDNAFRQATVVPSHLRDLATFPGAEFVVIANRNHSSSAEAYAQYRDTASAHPLSAAVIYTDEIFDEFGYGSITPWAIKRFCKYALDNWKEKPKYFLLWGKGYGNPRPNQPALVPTYGHPATDHEYISHFDPNSKDLNPEAAIGRVNILNDAEGMQYLNKVMEYEHTSWAPWMKEAVFLGGGANEAEQNFIGRGLERGVSYFEETFYGGKTTYFQKRSGQTVLDPSSAGFHDRISNGSLLVHFFGHSAVNIQDVDIRNANEYTNFGQYPLMVAMGCYGGNFTGGRSFGETWVLQKERGAIGYLANSNAGILASLRTYSDFFYTSWFQELPEGSAIGDVIVSTMDRFTSVNRDTRSFNHARQMNLQGDPAVKPYYPKFPDVAVKRSGVYFEPEVFTARDDSFQIFVEIENLAKVINDSIELTVTQQLPDGNTITHPARLIPVPRSQDTVSLWLYNPVGEQLVGANTFTIEVDAGQKLAEYDEENNQVSLEVSVPGNIANPLFPANLSIEGAEDLQLIASAFFSEQSGEIGYLFELDTTPQFNSGTKVSSGVIRGTPYFVSWNPSIPMEDSMTYYWRVRLSEVEPSIWRQASFTYLSGHSGWAQADPLQFVDNPSLDISLDISSERWSFAPQAIEFTFSTRRKGVVSYSINNAVAFDAALNAYSRNVVLYTVLDQNTLQSVFDDEFLGGGLHAANVPAELFKLKNAIRNARTGDYFLIGSNNNPRVHLWDEELFDLMNEIGVSDNIRLLQNEDPFIIFGRKGFPNSAIEIYRPNVGNRLELNQLLYTRKDSGQIWSPLVGPALSWDKFFWDWKSLDVSPQESAQLTLTGIQPEVLDTTILITDQTTQFDISHINAQRYPYMRLAVNVLDSLQKTAPQLENWYITYDPITDLTVDPSTFLLFESDTINTGDSMRLELALRNLTDTPSDSTWAFLILERSDRSQIQLDSVNVPPIEGRSVTNIGFEFSSSGNVIPGTAKLIVHLNPSRRPVEQYYFNNTFQQEFFVEADLTNPILDVTVDGRHILDGDIVSPRPEIIIQIDDENPVLAVTDTGAFELYFGAGTISVGLERIFSSDPRVEWIPASLPDNKAQIRFKPGLEFALPDDTYTLRVQAKDPSGNLASTNGEFFEMHFEVENDRTLTQVLNYPNPFSSSTRFVYTLTGEELPEVFQIQIYTLSGKQVRVIDLVELGEVHWGRNITDYAWDGTDEFGDPLGNGVYLYRTVVKFPSGFTLRTEGTEQYFKSGWGKMYLMR